MVDLTTVLSAGTFALTLKDRQDTQELQQQLANGQTPEGEMPPDLQVANEVADNTESVNQNLNRLIAIEQKRNPTPGDKDAFASATVQLDPGETVEVTVEPQDGWNLRVKRVEFDRRADHSYEINVGGDVTSVSNRAVYTSPKAVVQSDRILATATNNSGSSTTVDFEAEAWAERPET